MSEIITGNAKLGPEELRIGNFLEVDNMQYHPSLKGVVLKVTGISPAKGLEDEWTHSVGLRPIEKLNARSINSYSQLMQFIKPIPLTEDWLIKFGFIKHDMGWFWISWGTNGTEIIQWNISYKQYVFSLGKARFKTLEHVHQLQNLYFALTGKELILNPPTP
jgi:hypothetical protein